MSFKDDLENLKSTWFELSLLWKVVLGIMMFLQAISIASIGESVYEFKGFIIQGIELYRIITNQFIYWMNISEINRDLFDSVTWLVLFIGTVLRSYKSLRNRSYVGFTIIYTTSILVAMLLGFGVDYSQINSKEWLLSVLSVVCLFSYIAKSWMPLIYFIIPIILVSIFASISYGLSRS